MLTLATEIKKFMTSTPKQVEITTPLLTAVRLMKRHRIRHLPVLRKGKLKGIVTHRDIVALLAKRKVNLEEETVRSALTRNPYAVSPNASLGEVCNEMARCKYGSVVVVDKGRVVGIFTAVDALSAIYYTCVKGSRYSDAAA